MDTTEVGIKMTFSDEPSNTLVPMAVTVVGTNTATRVRQFLNAESRMNSESSGSVMLPSKPQSIQVAQGK